MNIVVAYQKKNRGIGLNNKIPWHLKNDLKHFRTLTTSGNGNLDNIVVMGRKTWESLPEKHRPLQNRINIILSKNMSEEDKYKIEESTVSYDPYVSFVTRDFSNVIDLINTPAEKNSNVFVIGGENIYKLALEMNIVKRIYATEIYTDLQCDRFFPKINTEKFKITDVSEFQKENDTYYRFIEYTNIELVPNVKLWKSEEHQYLDILQDIKLNGIIRGDRTGTGTKSLFGKHQTFNLRDTFPALTTRRVFMKGIFEELMLYLRGQTDNDILNKKGIHIWDGNTRREFLDKRGLTHYKEGDMGETYGFNFRHFGGEYKGCEHEYKKGVDGFDQLDNAIHLIKTDPTSRRIIITLWNPKTNKNAALPSCLCWYQFYVNTDEKTLNLMINIRSSDFFLANNWNVCTGALLVHLICNLNSIDLTPGDLIVNSGDTHLYLNHLEQVEENLQRPVQPLPKLVILNKKDNIEEFSYHDIKLVGYFPMKSIQAPMAV